MYDKLPRFYIPAFEITDSEPAARECKIKRHLKLLY